jgi:histone-lysine N-methyltransferase SETMAR
MTKQADQLHHNNAPAHSTALMQALTMHHITKVCQPLPPYSPDLAPCDFWLFPKAKITVEKDICECASHTVHKLSQCHLTAD